MLSLKYQLDFYVESSSRHWIYESRIMGKYQDSRYRAGSHRPMHFFFATFFLMDWMKLSRENIERGEGSQEHFNAECC